jgi:para-nitrobenzyl esterase
VLRRRTTQLESVASSPALAHGLTCGVELLPRHPIEAARRGATARIPLIIGTNRREASLLATSRRCCRRCGTPSIATSISSRPK